MAYTIKLHIIQNTIDKFSINENTCWHYANGGTWDREGGYHVLRMGGSGTSGMLRLGSNSKESFCLAVGVHNHRRWCDIVVDLKDDDTAQKIHPAYYLCDGSPMLWKQLSEITKTTRRGMNIGIKFSINEGTELCAELTISKPLNLLCLGMHDRQS